LLNFFERHQILFLIIFPVMIVGGMAVNAAGVVIAAGAVIYLLYKEKHDSIIILFLFILIMGDSRFEPTQFVKNLRVEVLILLFAVSLYEIRNGYYRVNAIMLYFLPFLSVSLLALIFSPLLDLGFSKTLSFAIFYFVVFNYIHHKLRVYGIQLMIDSLYLIVVILIASFILLPLFPDYLSYGGGRYNGLMGNPNGMGMLLTLTAPIATYLFTKHKEFKRSFKTLVWLLIIISLIMCSSRNAIFSLFLFAVTYIGLQGGTFRRIIFLFVFLPAVGVFLYNVELEDLFTYLGLEKYFRVSELESGSGRIFAWKHAFDIIQRQPLIGCGFACEEYHFVYRTSFQLWHSGHQGGVHNSYLAYAINTGFVGTTFFLGFLGIAASRVRNYRFLIPYLACCAFSAIFESWLFSSLSAFHILFLLFLAFLQVDTNKEELLVSNLAGDLSNAAAKGVVR
jgi:O-antigen ligase